MPRLHKSTFAVLTCVTFIILELAVKNDKVYALTMDFSKFYTSTYKLCMERAGGVVPEMTNCFNAEIDIQDGRLNQAYKMIMSRLDAVKKTYLRQSEREWIRKINPKCLKMSNPYDEPREQLGTDASLAYSQCYLDEKISRRLWLERFQ